VADPNTLYYEVAGRECSIQMRVEKSVVMAATKAESQPIETIYSFPLKKGIPKIFKFRETFIGSLFITQSLKTTDAGKVE
jgi:hypothetical protein